MGVALRTGCWSLLLGEAHYLPGHLFALDGLMFPLLELNRAILMSISCGFNMFLDDCLLLLLTRSYLRERELFIHNLCVFKLGCFAPLL